MSAAMTEAKTITFTLDGRKVTAAAGETVWQVAQREGNTIPHLGWRMRPAIAPTATAAPAWSRWKVSACWQLPACARPQTG